jgi:hypothetical protein
MKSHLAMLLVSLTMGPSCCLLAHAQDKEPAVEKVPEAVKGHEHTIDDIMRTHPGMTRDQASKEIEKVEKGFRPGVAPSSSGNTSRTAGIFELRPPTARSKISLSDDPKNSSPHFKLHVLDHADDDAEEHHSPHHGHAGHTNQPDRLSACSDFPDKAKCEEAVRKAAAQFNSSNPGVPAENNSTSKNPAQSNDGSH